jgi:MMP 1-O-methyltransferase
MPHPALELPFPLDTVRGFLARDEAQALYRAALSASRLAPVLEIGSYCGKSTLVLAAACRVTDSLVYAVDHHRGSEEHQPGQLFHDPALVHAPTGRFDSFAAFRDNLERAGLARWVAPVVQRAEYLAPHWRTPLGMLFIDGGHSLEAALADYRGWTGQLLAGGILAIHDVHGNAASGGQAPQAICQLAVQSGLFMMVGQVESLALLQRI